MRDIKRIFVHCTAGNQKQTLQSLLNEFKARGWKNPGYHYTVFPDGNIEQLLPESEISNGVQGYNSTSINISYVGGIDKQGRPVDNRTDAQKQSLCRILTELKRRYPNAHIMGHRDIWGKDSKKWKKWCPCFDAEAEYAYLDDVKVDKYDDATGVNDIGVLDDNTGAINPSAEPANPEKYVFKPIDYTEILKSTRQW